MDTDRLNRWLTLGANIAVLVGILFLAAEINQNTDMMRAQINQSRAEASMSEAQSVFNSDYLPVILVKLRAGDSISAVEQERYTHFLRGLHRILDNQLRQYREGFLAPNIPRSVRQAIMYEIAPTKVARQEWERTREMFSQEYGQLVDTVIAEYDTNNASD